MVRLGASVLILGYWFVPSVSAGTPSSTAMEIHSSRSSVAGTANVTCTDGNASGLWSMRQVDGSSWFVTPGWRELNIEVLRRGEMVDLDPDSFRVTMAIAGTVALRDVSSHFVVSAGRIKVRDASASSSQLSIGQPVTLAIVAQTRGVAGRSLSCNVLLYPTASIAPAQVRLRALSGETVRLPAGAFVRMTHVGTGHQFESDSTGYFMRLPHGTYQARLIDPTGSLSGEGIYALDERSLVLPVTVANKN